MLRHMIEKRILLGESLCFVCAINLLWLNELLDLPHRIFGTVPVPSNYPEALFESAVVAFLGLLVLSVTHYLLKKIKYLEGFLPVCNICGRINFAGRWISAHEYLEKHSEAMISHGLCPGCARRSLEGLEMGTAQNFHVIISKK